MCRSDNLVCMKPAVLFKREKKNRLGNTKQNNVPGVRLTSKTKSMLTGFCLLSVDKECDDVCLAPSLLSLAE